MDAIQTARRALLDGHRRLTSAELAALAALPADATGALADLAHEVRLAWCGDTVEVGQTLGIVEIMKQTDDVLGEALQYTRTLVAELSPPVLHEHGLAAGPQRDLFAAAAAADTAAKDATDPVADALRAVDPDALSPKDALELIYRLRKQLDA